jgi:hypothetical protein
MDNEALALNRKAYMNQAAAADQQPWRCIKCQAAIPNPNAPCACTRAQKEAADGR